MSEAEGPEPNGDAATMRQGLQREIIQLHKEFMGRGPIRSKLYLHEDSVLVLLFNGHTRAEHTMLEGGGRRSVAQTRVDMSESIRARFIEVVERYTGREVVGFMSSSQQGPDLLSHVYVLRPTDLLSVVPSQPEESSE